MKIKNIIEDKINNFINEQNDYNLINHEQFNDALLNLTTLSLEDGQVRYPKSEGRELTHLFGGFNYDAYILDRTSLPTSGPFEIIITDNDDNTIGFIRGNKNASIISINLIHIQEDSRGNGTGTDIYEKFINDGFIIKSDKEITDDTYSMYDRLVKTGYSPLIFRDGTVGLIKQNKTK